MRENPEHQLLGSVLIDPPRFADVAGIVAGSDFADEQLGLLFDTLADRYDGGQAIDVPLIVPVAQKIGVAKGTVARIVTDCATAANARYYASEIRKASHGRRLMAAADDLRQRAKDDPGAAADWMAATLDAMHGTTTATTLEDALSEWIDDVSRDDRRRAVMTGLPEVDSATGGLLPTQMVTIAAGPGGGKSALGAQVALTVARRCGPVLLASAEMLAPEIAQRLLRQHVDLPLNDYGQRHPSPQEVEAMRSAAATIADTPLNFVIDGELTVRKIRGQAKQLKGLQLIVVDYLQLLTGKRDFYRSQRDEVTEISRDLKRIAQSLEVPVLCLAQINRDSQKANAKGKVQRPALSSLAESSAIERDSDQVWFLHPDGELPDPFNVELVVRKNRNGKRDAVIELAFYPEECAFADGSELRRETAFDVWNG